MNAAKRRSVSGSEKKIKVADVLNREKISRPRQRTPILSTCMYAKASTDISLLGSRQSEEVQLQGTTVIH